MMASYAFSMVTLLMLVCLGSYGFVLSTPSESKGYADKPSTPRPQASKIAANAPPDTTSTVCLNESQTCGADGVVLQPKGEHHPWYSIRPLKEGVQWATNPGPYFKTMIDEHDDEPVFKVHPGLATIALTDHTSGKWFFDQPDTVLDRQVRSSEKVRLACSCKFKHDTVQYGLAPAFLPLSRCKVIMQVKVKVKVNDVLLLLLYLL